eukprot:959279-Prorocentrum_minimum.AAC.1
MGASHWPSPGVLPEHGRVPLSELGTRTTSPSPSPAPTTPTSRSTTLPMSRFRASRAPRYNQADRPPTHPAPRDPRTQTRNKKAKRRKKRNRLRATAFRGTGFATLEEFPTVLEEFSTSSPDRRLGPCEGSRLSARAEENVRPRLRCSLRGGEVRFGRVPGREGSC